MVASLNIKGKLWLKKQFVLTSYYLAQCAKNEITFQKKIAATILVGLN